MQKFAGSAHRVSILPIPRKASLSQLSRRHSAAYSEFQSFHHGRGRFLRCSMRWACCHWKTFNPSTTEGIAIAKCVVSSGLDVVLQSYTNKGIAIWNARHVFRHWPMFQSFLKVLDSSQSKKSLASSQPESQYSHSGILFISMLYKKRLQSFPTEKGISILLERLEKRCADSLNPLNSRKAIIRMGIAQHWMAPCVSILNKGINTRAGDVDRNENNARFNLLNSEKVLLLRNLINDTRRLIFESSRPRKVLLPKYSSGSPESARVSILSIQKGVNNQTQGLC